MPPQPSTRRPRGQQESQSLYEGDTDVDSDQGTPKPQRLKKRLSEANAPDNDTSFTLESGRPPLRTKSVNINDDAAEKRKRRKSTKLNVIDTALPGSENMTSDADHGEPVRAGKQKQLNTVAPPQISDTPFDVMNSNFEEWMKMATDNVSQLLPAPIFISQMNAENQCHKLVEFCAHRLLP